MNNQVIAHIAGAPARPLEDPYSNAKTLDSVWFVLPFGFLMLGVIIYAIISTVRNPLTTLAKKI